MKSVRLTLTICIFSSIAYANEDVDGCLKKAKTTNDSEMCVEADVKRLDAELLRVYERTVLMDNEKGAVDALRKAQDTWERYRDQDCEAVSLTYGSGTYATTAYHLCMKDHANQRISDLKAWHPAEWEKH
ncbi:lysozyme inhibitor LprI family protein [Pseudomonas syringae pv. coryli]|uniref:lysozyme inhibitor LprI family protein n=1 Tax=Pseudomonas syringae pv. coryli TaxID=317659 RepID=UPI003D2AA6CE